MRDSTHLAPRLTGIVFAIGGGAAVGHAMVFASSGTLPVEVKILGGLGAIACYIGGLMHGGTSP